jgi:hypothetical protein
LARVGGVPLGPSGCCTLLLYRLGLRVNLPLVGCPVASIRIDVPDMGAVVASVSKAGTVVSDLVSFVRGLGAPVNLGIAQPVSGVAHVLAVIDPAFADVQLRIADGGLGVAHLQVKLVLVSVALHVSPRTAVTDRLPDIVRRHLAAAVRGCRRSFRCREPTVTLGMLRRACKVLRRLVMDIGAHGGSLSDGIRCPRQGLEVLGRLAGGFGHPIAQWPLLALLHVGNYSLLANLTPSLAALPRATPEPGGRGQGLSGQGWAPHDQVSMAAVKVDQPRDRSVPSVSSSRVTAGCGLVRGQEVWHGFVQSVAVSSVAVLCCRTFPTTFVKDEGGTAAVTALGRSSGPRLYHRHRDDDPDFRAYRIAGPVTQESRILISATPTYSPRAINSHPAASNPCFTMPLTCHIQPLS